MDNNFIKLKTALYLFLILQLPFSIIARERTDPQTDRDTLLSVARNIIEEAPFCILISLDSTGHPSARIMDPFSPEKDMAIWFGTNKDSRKVLELKNDPRVTLYYQNANGAGYAVIKGNAYLVDDPANKEIYWKNDWNRFYDDQKENFILIKVVPYRLEVLDYMKGIVGDSKTWTVPYIEFKQN